MQHAGLTQTALAAKFGVTRETVNDWVARGAVIKPASGKYDFETCAASLYKWQASRLAGRSGNVGKSGLDLSAERAKLAKEQTEGIALKNALAKGDLVTRQAVEAFMIADYTLVRERLLSIPGKIADALGSTEHPAHEVESVLRNEINEALGELHDPASLGAGDLEEDQADSAAGAEAAADADPDRVGEQISRRTKGY